MRHADSLLVRTRIPKDQFGRYLRTGSWLRPDDHVEVKFNPWHDPKTGRFTFKGGGNGTWSGGGFTGGGGGSTGGGGASGNWGPPGKTQADQSRSQRVTITGKPGASAIRTVAASAVSSPTGTTVARNGYTYKIDDEGRTTQVTGTLTLNPNQTRSRAAQAAAGGGPTADRRWRSLCRCTLRWPDGHVQSFHTGRQLQSRRLSHVGESMGEGRQTGRSGMGEDRAGICRIVAATGQHRYLLQRGRSLRSQDVFEQQFQGKIAWRIMSAHC